MLQLKRHFYKVLDTADRIDFLYGAECWTIKKSEEGKKLHVAGMYIPRWTGVVTFPIEVLLKPIKKKKTLDGCVELQQKIDY